MAGEEERRNYSPLFEGENTMGARSVCSSIAYFKIYERRFGRIPTVFEKIMLVLITYDVNTEDAGGRKRLRKVAKECVNYGQRVQNSVFECVLDAAQYRLVKHKLEQLIDTEKDSLRFYNLGNNYQTKIEHIGAKAGYQPEGLLML